jgi:hypothetical protein
MARKKARKMKRLGRGRGRGRGRGQRPAPGRTPGVLPSKPCHMHAHTRTQTHGHAGTHKHTGTQSLDGLTMVSGWTSNECWAAGCGLGALSHKNGKGDTPDTHFDVNAVLGKSQGCNGLCVGSSSPPMSTQPFMAPIDFISMDFMLQTSKNNSDSRFCHSHMSLVT